MRRREFIAGLSSAAAWPAATRARFELLPDVPTIAESGYKDYEANLWFGLFAPAKTPKGVVSQLARWFGAALRDAEVRAKLVAQGLYPAAMCDADFGAFLRK
jgi:tripartite-type tricarboxylate transporter receptor subunit TctC